MAAVSRATLKTYFETADFPPEEHFFNLIDSMVNIEDEGAPISFLPSPPASSSDTGSPGNLAADSDYFYVCVATNTWRRIPISDW